MQLHNHKHAVSSQDDTKTVQPQKHTQFVQPQEYTPKHYAQLIPVPRPDANKFSRGAVAIIAGSLRYPGAAILATSSATASARCGAGYTTLITPKSAVFAAQAHLVSIPVVGVAESGGAFMKAAVEATKKAAAKAKALVIGPGLDRSAQTEAFFKELLKDEDRPVVIDADALYFAKSIINDSTKQLFPNRVYTPHEGEAARMLSRPIKNREQDALELARLYCGTVVLKGPQTLIATADGTLIVSKNAGPELAKAGSGDVLAGMIGAFLAQGLCTDKAASLAVYIHGHAGKLAASKNGVVSVMAEDVCDNIAPAICELMNGDIDG